MAENKPDAPAALAQTHEPAPADSADDSAGLHRDDEFYTCPTLTSIDETRPYERRPGEPVYRRLKIFTLDPSISKLEGAISTLKVPF